MPISRFRAHAVCLLVAGFLSAGLLPEVRASTVVVPSFSELVKNADTIVQGVVKGKTVRWENDTGGAPAIFTTVRVAVSEVYKGAIQGELALKVAGGEIDGVRDAVQGAPVFENGRRYVLFIQNNGTQLVPLVALTYGQYEVIADAKGVARLFRADHSPVTSMQEIDAEAGRISSHLHSTRSTASHVPAMEAKAFAGEIKRAVAKQKSAP